MFTELYGYPCYRKILDNIRGKINTAVFGVPESEAAFIAAGIGKPVFMVAPDFLTAKRLVRQLNALGGDFVYMPFEDDALIFKKRSARSFSAEKALALYRILEGGNVVVPAEALMRLYPEQGLFSRNIFTIKSDEEVSPLYLASALTAAGYRRTSLVENAGDFSLRGDILDIFSPSEELPVRIEFFGDTPERMRFFSPETHTSLREADSITVIPVCDVFPEDAPSAVEKLKKYGKKLSPDARARFEAISSELETSPDNPWLLPYAKYSLVSDYLSQESITVWLEPKHITDRLQRLHKEYVSRTGFLMERGEIAEGVAESFPDPETALNAPMEKCCGLAFQSIAASGFFAAADTVGLSSSRTSSYRMNMQQIASDLDFWLKEGYRVGIFTGNRENAERLNAFLSDNNVALNIREDFSDSLVNGCIIAKSFEDGFISRSARLVLLGDNRLYARENVRRLSRRGKNAFLAVEEGDYVVHETHGIGLCAGVTTISGENGDKDYIVVKYRNNDTLYVPVELSDILSKYSGSDTAPRLSALGGGEFEKVKAKVKSGIKEMTVDLVRLYTQRERPRGFRYKDTGYLEEAFAQAFPYKETDDQLRCIEEINKDLSSEKIMDRLLVGDVGFGKTEVAMRAAFKVAANGRQVVLMAPTTILSEQHKNTFIERFSPFNIKVVCLNRFRTSEETSRILKEIKSGEAEIIIGTHKLLSKKIEYKDMGLLILDEEQRFGVEHKELLKTIQTNVDVLSMSATPIPRTLHMALTGIRDISTINSPPAERLPVESFVVEDSPALIRDVIIREISRKGQVFLVYNRVETIDAFSAGIRELVPEARIAVAHGRMPEKELENAVIAFAHGEKDVMICTTIIENGIDIPDANTLIVYDADNLGLSQLYQLKGRVGRSNKPAFAYFVYRENKILSDIAYKRLSGIMENYELGSGFKIAMKDLEIRGAGNVLGREQHGHMEKVGYDMYVKLLEEVVAEAKGEEPPSRKTASIEVDLDAHVPSGYIESSEARMDFYRRLAEVSDYSQKTALADELKDIYGSLPKPVSNLLDIAELKAACKRVGAEKLVINKRQVKLVVPNSGKILKAISAFSSLLKLETEGNNLSVNFRFKNKSPKYAVSAVRAFLEIAGSDE